MKVLIFGGTTEGRELSSIMSNAGINITLSVTTEYGKNAVTENGIKILAETLAEEGMIDLFKKETFDYVIDATHPYAVLATHNIHSACRIAGLKYLRLKRPESGKVPGITYVPDTQSAVEILKKTEGRVLLAIGSKELESFTHIKNFADRFFVRILPMPDSLKKTLDMGFRGSNIICMQGPFDKEMNIAVIKTTNAKFLVTKDSGDAGGFDAKISAAIYFGCEVIVIARPSLEEGYTFDELLTRFKIKKNPMNAPEPEVKDRKFFPLFFDMNGRKVLVIGGGNVAERRIKILSGFGAEITVISPAVTGYIEQLAAIGTIKLLKRKYKKNDIMDLSPFFVISAAGERNVNHSVMVEAKSHGIHVSVADCKKECTCFFPAIAESKDYIAGLISKNNNHTGVKETAKKLRELLDS